MVERRRTNRVPFAGEAKLTLDGRAADVRARDPDSRSGAMAGLASPSGPVTIPTQVRDVALTGALVEVAGAIVGSCGALVLRSSVGPIALTDGETGRPASSGRLVLDLDGGVAIAMQVAVAWWRLGVADRGARTGRDAEREPGDRATPQRAWLGLRRMAIDPDSAAHLRRLVELNLGDASLLERDFSALAATVGAPR